MSTSLVAIIGSTEYSLSDGDPRFRLEEDGLGMAPTRRITERGPLQHGETDLGFRLDPRLIPLVFGVSAATESDLYDYRAALLAIFKPRTAAIKLRYTLSNGDVRQIDTHYAGAMTFPSRDRKGFYQRGGLTLRASDPLFYDPTLQSVSYGLGGGSGSGAVPTPVPTAVGASAIDQTQAIIYGGDFLEYPVLTVNGPIADCVITNETTGEVLDFTGYTLTTGMVIDCRYGYKTITKTDGTNLIDKLTNASDLATFHLEASPDAAGGENLINVTGSGVDANTQIILQWYSRYIGL